MYKKEKIKLLVILIVSAFLIYIIAIERTVQEYKSLIENREKFVNYKAIKQKKDSLKKIYGGKEKLIENNKENSPNVRNSIINFIENNRKENIKIIEYNGPVVILKENNDKISEYINILKLSGPFKSLLLILNEFEHKFSRADIASVDFKLRKNYQSNKEKLYVTFYFITPEAK